MEIKPIAYIKTDFKEKFGIPRQSGLVQELTGEIVFEKDYGSDESLRGIDEYSYLWLIFDFSKNHREKQSPTVRPPRLGGNTRVGVFATRSPFRPNNLGLSCVKLEKIIKDENSRNILVVSGVDLLDNTPIFDIKPYIPYCDSKPDAAGSFAEKNKDYKITVTYPDNIFENFPQNKVSALLKCLEQNPCPAYQNNERIYKMNFADFDITFSKNGDEINLLKIEKN